MMLTTAAAEPACPACGSKTTLTAQEAAGASIAPQFCVAVNSS